MTTYDVLLGAVHLLICVPSLVLNVAIGLTIHLSRDIYKSPSYKILQQLNLAYFIHSTVHLGVGITILADIDDHNTVKKLLGAFTDVGWIGIMFLNFLLCLERLNVTVLKNPFKLRCSAFTIVSLLAWLPGIVLFLFDLTPYVTFYFNAESAQWDFMGEFSQAIIEASQVLTFTILPSTFICYILIYAHLAKQRRFYTQAAFQRRPSIELHVLFAATLMFLYQFLEELMYFVLYTVGEGSYWGRLTVHLLFVALPMFSHVVAVSINRSLRKDFQEQTCSLGRMHTRIRFNMFRTVRW